VSAAAWWLPLCSGPDRAASKRGRSRHHHPGDRPPRSEGRLRGLVDHVIHLDRRNHHGLHLLTPSPCFSPAMASPGGASDAKEELEQLLIRERNQFYECRDVTNPQLQALCSEPAE
jgi:hypothetical protein